MIFENNIGVQLVFFFAPKIMNNLFHRMIFWRVYMYNFLTKWNTLVCCYMPHWIVMIFRDKWNRYTVQQTSS